MIQNIEAKLVGEGIEIFDLDKETRRETIIQAWDRWNEILKEKSEIITKDWREPERLEIEGVTYEIRGIYHGPTSDIWRHSQRRVDISTEADEAFKFPSNLVFFEENLLSCQKAFKLSDIKHSVTNFNTLKANGYFGDADIPDQSKQEHLDFLKKYNRCYGAASELLETIIPDHSNIDFCPSLIRFVHMPQPFRMEKNLLYLESRLTTLDKDDPEGLFLYIGLTPSRPAFMVKKLLGVVEHQKAFGDQEVKNVRLYCGVGHVDEVLFLLKNTSYIDRYFVLPSEQDSKCMPLAKRVGSLLATWGKYLTARN